MNCVIQITDFHRLGLQRMLTLSAAISARFALVFALREKLSETFKSPGMVPFSFLPHITSLHSREEGFEK